MLIDSVAGIVKKIKLSGILLYIIFTFFMILAVKNKVNMHVDEVCSYGLSNSTQGGGDI